MFKIVSIDVLDNPCNFVQPFLFEIHFECDEIMNEQEFEWKVIYVGSAESEEFDQTLLHQFYGPFTTGQHTILLQSKPPNPEEIPIEELVGISAVLVVGRCRREQYFQVGYFVRNELPEEDDPETDQGFDKIQRTVIQSLSGVQTFKAGVDDFDISQMEKHFNALHVAEI